MLNQIVLVGRLKEIEYEDEVNVEFTLVVPRNYKNIDGIYEEDNIPVYISGSIAKNFKEYCKKGDLIGVKGRIQVKDNDIEIVAEKITFLSNKKVDEE